MILLANGCSMTYGAELDMNPGFSPKENYDYRLDKSWPGQLSKMLHCEEFYNIAEGGSSNERILRTTLEWTAKYLEEKNDSSDLFVVIGWSAPSRYEVKLKTRGWIDIHPTYLPPENDIEAREITKFYSKYITNEKADELKSLVHIIALQSWFKLNKIPYLFFRALPFLHKQNLDAQIYAKQIDQKRYYKFDEDSYNMHGTISLKELPVGLRRHPLEQGHLFWANELYEYTAKEKLMRPD